MNKKYAIVIGNDPKSNLSRLTMFASQMVKYGRHPPFITRFERSEDFCSFIDANDSKFEFNRDDDDLVTIEAKIFRDNNVFFKFATSIGDRLTPFVEDLFIAVARSRRGVRIIDLANSKNLSSDTVKFIVNKLLSETSFDLEFGTIGKLVVDQIYSNLSVITEDDCLRPTSLLAIPHVSGVSNEITIANSSDQMRYLSQVALRSAKADDLVSVWELIY